jgi:hypothetical protein
LPLFGFDKKKKKTQHATKANAARQPYQAAMVDLCFRGSHLLRGRLLTGTEL